LIPRGVNFFCSFIDLIWDSSLVQKDAKEKTSEASPDNHDVGLLAVADWRKLRGAV
jgi:hypothetical protein